MLFASLDEIIDGTPDPKPKTERIIATCALGEKGCFTDGKCYYNRSCENKVVTHADRIRAMSDEELAVWLAKLANGDVYTDFCDNPARTVVCDSKCVGCIAEWLKQPEKDGDNDG